MEPCQIVRCEIDEAALVNGAGARRISYDELYEATNSFSKDAVLEDGYGGVVYKARLKELDKIVAVKKLKGRFPDQTKKEFIAKINNTGNLRHRNLIQLIGWCCQYSGNGNGRGELLLVYEFAPNCGLDKHLFGEELPSLSWENRYKIACGLASGVDYLHSGWEKCVIHRDIKPGNVMLGHDWTPKLGNFWLARSTDHEQTMSSTLAWGSYYYMAPEIYYTGEKASKASDVYSFGIVALEIATGKGPSVRQPRSAMPLVSWVWDLSEIGRILEAVDGRLDTGFDKIQAERLLVVGLWCCHTKASDRPQMNQVVAVLNGHTRLIDVPLKPRDDYLDSSSVEDNEQDDIEEVALNEIGHEIDEAPTLTISYQDLYQATNSFSEDAKIGEGQYGLVYKANLQDPYGVLAVKKMKGRFQKQSNQGLLAEINTMGKLRHPNLVQLIGKCEEDEEILLILEYMEKRSLNKHLFNPKLPPLSWENRYKIACGLASGIEYLHTGSQKCVIHRDIKPANVMLDSDWTPKLGDFGLARLTDHGKSMHNTIQHGTRGYMAPELLNTGGKASKESDVFSFGIIALELATGRTRCIMPETGMPLLSWVWTLHDKDDILKAVDCRLRSRLRTNQLIDETDQAKRLLVVGLWCCNTRACERPQMNDVIAVLDGHTHLSAAIVKVKRQEDFYGAFIDA